MDHSKIEWTDATWNPIRGCSRVSKGCENCYAEKIARRFSGPGQNYDGLIGKTGAWNGKTRFIASALLLPLKWRRARMIFVNSMSDLFHESVSTKDIDRVFAVMLLAHWHYFQILTKRSARMLAYCKDPQMPPRVLLEAAKMMNIDEVARLRRRRPNPSPWATTTKQHLPNVWLGVSVEDQPTFDERVPDLQKTPAAVRFLSVEPQIASIDPCEAFGIWWNQTMQCWEGVGALFNPGVDWVINGGESGPGARALHPDWARRWRDICAALGIAYFFKQWGAWQPLSTIDGRQMLPFSEYVLPAAGAPGFGFIKKGKKLAGRLLDGVEHNEFPGERA